MLDAYIYAGLRTPFGRHAGALSTVRPDDLAGLLLARLAETSGFAVDDLEDVILGCTNQAGEDSRNLARNALLAAGLPARLPGQTVNRLCASGLSAVIDAARAISCGEGRLYLAGGAESMSRAPFVMAKAESAFSRTLEVFDSTIGARFANPRLVERYGNDSMPETGDNVARAFGIAREDADRFAASSQARYQAALEEGFSSARSFRWRCVPDARARRGWWSATSIRGRRPTWRPWRACRRCSPAGSDRRQCLGDQRRGGGSAAGRSRDRRARGHPAAGADPR